MNVVQVRFPQSTSPIFNNEDIPISNKSLKRALFSKLKILIEPSGGARSLSEQEKYKKVERSKQLKITKKLNISQGKDFSSQGIKPAPVPPFKVTLIKGRYQRKFNLETEAQSPNQRIFEFQAANLSPFQNSEKALKETKTNFLKNMLKYKLNSEKQVQLKKALVNNSQKQTLDNFFKNQGSPTQLNSDSYTYFNVLNLPQNWNDNFYKTQQMLKERNKKQQETTKSTLQYRDNFKQEERPQVQSEKFIVSNKNLRYKDITKQRVVDQYLRDDVLKSYEHKSQEELVQVQNDKLNLYYGTMDFKYRPKIRNEKNPNTLFQDQNDLSHDHDDFLNYVECVKKIG